MGAVHAFLKSFLVVGLTALLLGFLVPAQASNGGVDLTEFYMITGPYKLLTTGGTFRTKSNNDDCTAVTTSSTGSITWPTGAKVDKAYLLWAASGSSIDNTVNLNGNEITVNSSQYCHLVDTVYGIKFYGCVADVTEYVSASTQNYTLTDLTIDTGSPYRDYCTVLGGWSLVVIYHAPDTLDELNFIKLYEGLEWVHNDSLPQSTVSGFVAANPASLNVLSIAWEGDPDLNNNEVVRINNQQVGSNLFDSNSTAFSQNNTYGVDVDVVDASSQISAGDTSLTWDASTGQDLVVVQMLGLYDLSVTGVSGFVYEDIDGNGDLSDERPVEGATVKLYDSAGSLVGQTETDTDGFYFFANLQAGNYYVVVDSKTITPAGFNAGHDQSEVWAEQTWVNAPAGAAVAYCDADADSNTAPDELSGSQLCFGGAYGNRSDDASSLSSAEHKVKVSVGDTVVPNVSFAFSFNVVTNTNDQDDDTENPRTCQGCLRQFIQNANAIQGANAMRFVPVVPTNASGSGGVWWQVQLGLTADSTSGYALPDITDSGTTLDGTAYSYQDGTTVRDTNGGSISAPGTVGVSKTALAPYEKPELEIDVNDKGSGIVVDASDTVVRSLALFNSTEASNVSLILVTPGSSGGSKVEDSFIGPRADGSNPGSGNWGRAGVTIKPDAQMNVRHNYVARLYNTGIELKGVGVVEKNLIEHLGMTAPCGDGVSFEGGPLRSRDDVIVQYNYIRKVAAYGVESWQAPGAYTVRENTITATGQGDKSYNYCGQSSGTDINLSERGGVRIFGSGSLVQGNVIYGVPGHGVVVVPIKTDASRTPSKKNTISQNSIYDNGGLSIDLDQGDGSGNPNGDGVTPNDGRTDSSAQNNGVDYPVFTAVRLKGSTLHVEGYVGTDAQHLSGTFTIEVYKADDDHNNNGEVFSGDDLRVPHGEGHWYLGSCTTNSNGTFACDLTIPSGVDPVDYITGTATDQDGNTSEFGANAKVVPVGVPVEGVLYQDLEPNGVRDGDDSGVRPRSPMYVKLFVDGDGDCRNGFGASADQVVEVGSDGSYRFEVVTSGNYCLVLDDGNSETDSTPYDPSGDGWIYVNPPGGVLPLVVTEGQVAGGQPVRGNDFGLFHGARVEGVVFRDTGDGEGTANDALQNGAEPGVPNVTVTASDGSHTRTAVTSATGQYVLYIPADWGNTAISHPIRPASGRNLNGGSVHTPENWTEASASDSASAKFTLGAASSLAGEQLSGYNFGVVFAAEFRPDQTGTTTTPGTVVYRHTYRPGTQGTVEIGLVSGAYTYQLRRDANCDGDFEDSEEDWVAGLSFQVTDSWPRNPDGSFKACAVEVRVIVPDGEPEGALDVAQFGANLKWANNTGVVDKKSVTDATTVRILGTLRLDKLGRVVGNPTTDTEPANYPDDYAPSVEGQPGDVLEYCIAYRNVGSDAVSDVVITDPVPFFTDPLADAYGPGKAIYWKDAGGTVRYLTSDDGDDAGAIAGGLVEVQAEAALAAGEGGLVCYRVQIR